jgi:hypothetical protein
MHQKRHPNKNHQEGITRQINPDPTFNSSLLLVDGHHLPFRNQVVNFLMLRLQYFDAFPQTGVGSVFLWMISYATILLSMRTLLVGTIQSRKDRKHSPFDLVR